MHALTYLRIDNEAFGKMTAWLRDERKLSPKYIARVVSYFNRSEHPVWLGQVALDIGHSLERTQQLFDDLVEQGVIRRMTGEEKAKAKIEQVANVYVLVGKPHPSKVLW
jgi:hypothetical protein